MRESLMYGSVRGARGNSRPYRDDLLHCTSQLLAVRPEGANHQWRRNPPRRSANASSDVGWSNPITGIAGCCARAASGHAEDAAAPPMRVMNSRRRSR